MQLKRVTTDDDGTQEIKIGDKKTSVIISVGKRGVEIWSNRHLAAEPQRAMNKISVKIERRAKNND